MKKMISLFLSIVMIFTLSIQAFAAEDTSYHVIQDNSMVRIAEEYIDGIKYVYTFSKISQELTTQTFDSKKSLTSSKTLSLAKFAIDDSAYDEQIELYSSSYYQHTFLNYEYDELTKNQYQLRKKDIKVIRYLPDDREAIDNYIDAVDTLNAAELAVLATGGATLFWAIVTYFDAGLTAGETATALGIAAGDVIALRLAINKCERVWKLYVE